MLLILLELGIPEIDLDITFVLNSSMRKLNHQFRKKDYPTDVLSFPLHEKKIARRGGVFLGDVIIAVAVANKQAQEQNHPLLHELYFLIIHGILHLLGYDHEKTQREAVIMQNMEKKLMRKILKEGV